MEKIIYTGFFVNQKEVLEQFPVDTEKYPNVFAHHCTHIFKPTDKEVKEFTDKGIHGWKLQIIKRVKTDKVDVLILKYNFYSDNKYPHITLATAKGVKPFESNAEILKLEKENELFIEFKDGILKSTSDGILKSTEHYGVLTRFTEDIDAEINYFKGVYTSDNKTKKLGQAVIVDIDRTLCNITENGEIYNGGDDTKRRPYDWDRVAEDKPIEAMCQLVRSIREKYHIVLLTGRSEDAREGTKKWLKKNHIHYDKLLMKASGSYEQSAITKYESYVNDIKDEYDIAFAIDDDQRIVDMWQKEGIICLKV